MTTRRIAKHEWVEGRLPPNPGGEPDGLVPTTQDGEYTLAEPSGGEGNVQVVRQLDEEPLPTRPDVDSVIWIARDEPPTNPLDLWVRLVTEHPFVTLMNDLAPIHWWRCSETEGGIIEDVVGELHATVHSGSLQQSIGSLDPQVADALGSGIGGPASASTPPQSEVSNLTAVTMMAVVRRSASGANTNIFMITNDSGSFTAATLGIGETPSGEARAYAKRSGDNASTDAMDWSGFSSDTTVVFFARHVNGNAGELWASVDGGEASLRATAPFSRTRSDEPALPINIMGPSGDSGRRFAGVGDEFAIFDRALSGTEMNQIVDAIFGNGGD